MSRSPRTTVVACAAVALAAGALAALPAQPAVAAGTPFVSELHYDNAGTDAGEAIEVSADPGTDLSGWTLVLYNGTGGTAYGTAASLPSPVTDTGAVAVTYPANGIQNGAPDGLALVRPDGTVAEFLSYEGTFTATGGPAAGLAGTDIGVAEDGSDAPGGSLQKIGDAWQKATTSSFGTANEDGGTDPEPPADPCTVTAPTAISAVQGSGSASPIAGQLVTVRGVVVADLQDGGLGGYHLQDPVGDGDSATSDAVFVFAPAGPGVSTGDEVAVTGTVLEYNGLTEIGTVTATGVCDTGLALPEATPLDLPATDEQREPLEGMLVNPVGPLTVTEVYDLNRYGELLLSADGLLRQPTEIAEPGTAARQVAQANTDRSVVLDDGSSQNYLTTGNPAPFLAKGDSVRAGDSVATVDPVVLSYGFGAWRLQPADGTADGTTFSPDNSRPAAPPSVGGDLKLASVNVLNYFVTLGQRGAQTAEEFTAQQTKIVSEITALNADVIALQEIENSYRTTGVRDAALADLVGALNAEAGQETWAYVASPANLPPADQTDVITVAIIYRAARVVPVGAAVAQVDETVWGNAREPIAQTFSADGDTFTVIANHLKSKGADGATGDNADTGDGQGAYNGDRARQAAAVARFATERAAASGDPDVILLGDFNSYANEDPIDVLTGAGLTDLEAAKAPGSFTYVFDGQAGSLDHALATASLAGKVAGVAAWNINSVESPAYGYSGDSRLYAGDPYRASDHDPLLIGIDLAEQCGGATPTLRGTHRADVLVGTTGRDVIWAGDGNDLVLGRDGHDVICGGTGSDIILGGTGNDLIFGGAGNDRLFGEAGDDQLTGGPGSDLLFAGRGDDQLIFGGPAW